MPIIKQHPLQQQTAVFLDGAFEVNNAPQETLSANTQPVALEAAAAGFYDGMLASQLIRIDKVAKLVKQKAK